MLSGFLAVLVLTVKILAMIHRFVHTLHCLLSTLVRAEPLGRIVQSFPFHDGCFHRFALSSRRNYDKFTMKEAGNTDERENIDHLIYG